jgi:UDP-N-acetylmuramate dehydrogenase
MIVVEQNVSLAPHNSFGIVAKARELVRVRGVADVVQLLADPALAGRPKFILGGGSNIVLTGDVRPLVLKVEVMGRASSTTAPRPPSSRSAPARTGTRRWPGASTRASAGWRTWP